jgi:hypothetical protein
MKKKKDGELIPDSVVKKYFITAADDKPYNTIEQETNP